MVKHTQTIRRQFVDNLLECFDHFVGLALKGLTKQKCFLYEDQNFLPTINWKLKS